jgi:glycine/D-amino acid oxidase-like deaminating enzyme
MSANNEIGPGGRHTHAAAAGQPGSHYDFIVCGSGPSGCVVAARLAENPAVKVILIEVGGTDDVLSAGPYRQHGQGAGRRIEHQRHGLGQGPPDAGRQFRACAQYLFPRKLRDKPLDHRPCLLWQRTGTVRTTANLSSMSMQLQLYQVRYFLALARTLNFTRAAEQCNVTQPAVPVGNSILLATDIESGDAPALCERFVA